MSEKILRSPPVCGSSGKGGRSCAQRTVVPLFGKPKGLSKQLIGRSAQRSGRFMWVLLLREDHGEQIAQHLAERLQVHCVARDGREGQLAALERVGNIVLFGEVGFLLLKIELAVSCLIDAGLLVLFQRAQQGLFVELADLFGDIVRNAGAGALLEGSVVVLTGQSGFLGGLVERRLNGGAAALQNRCRLRPASECRERAGSGRPDPLRQGRAGS